MATTNPQPMHSEDEHSDDSIRPRGRIPILRSTRDSDDPCRDEELADGLISPAETDEMDDAANFEDQSSTTDSCSSFGDSEDTDDIELG
ncbi:hypothetical protein S7711_11212 [Stachybotrys chartarum IBT 7711]|uniref:Uncharacterized protein n=1 Tax=Stachybotrys chartarum (strain CBS 109288 / IBT 7711) TaxID=1280523 RepID=A0A084AHK3_STACB|nr:hypothetical protein S7711_11212 [Stachybotrys chartarum IBT 7711]